MSKWGIIVKSKPFINWRNPTDENLKDESFKMIGSRLNKIGSIDGFDICCIYWQAEFRRSNKKLPYSLCSIHKDFDIEFKEILNAMKSANEHCGRFLHNMSEKNNVAESLFGKYYEMPELPTQEDVFDSIIMGKKKGSRKAWGIAMMYGTNDAKPYVSLEDKIKIIQNDKYNKCKIPYYKSKAFASELIKKYEYDLQRLDIDYNAIILES